MSKFKKSFIYNCTKESSFCSWSNADQTYISAIGSFPYLFKCRNRFWCRSAIYFIYCFGIHQQNIRESYDAPVITHIQNSSRQKRYSPVATIFTRIELTETTLVFNI